MGSPDYAEAMSAIKRVHRCIKRNHCGPVLAIRTDSAVTFCTAYPKRNIQVVLKTYMHPLEVLTSFDIDCCTFGFDGTAVVSTARGVRSASTRCNTVDLQRRSQTYERYSFTNRNPRM